MWGSGFQVQGWGFRVKGGLGLRTVWGVGGLGVKDGLGFRGG